jgi:uncharacterized protein
MTRPETTAGFPALRGHQFMRFTTFRKNGQPVPTPVWFVERGQKLYVFTRANAGKVKRVRATGRAEVAPCDARGTLLGETARGTARVLAPGETPPIYELFIKKYGFQMRFFALLGRLRGATPDYLEIVPEEGT